MSAPAATVPFLAATVLLGVAGLAKLRSPGDTARALHAAGLRVGWTAVRAGALAEVAVSVAALAAPGALSGALVSACYGGFTVFVVAAMVKGWPLSSCGCFAKPDAEPTYQHAAVDLGACAAAGWWAASAPGAIGPLFARQPWHGAPLALLVAVTAGLAYLVWANPLSRRLA